MVTVLLALAQTLYTDHGNPAAAERRGLEILAALLFRARRRV